MGNLVMGTTIAWSGPAIPYLKKPPAEDGFNVTDNEGSWIGSLMPLGALVGGPLAGFLISKLGKKGTMFVSATLFTLSYLMLIVAPNVATIYFGRLVGGVATGIASLVCPVYVAEVAKPEVRGLLGSGVQVQYFGMYLSLIFHESRQKNCTCFLNIDQGSLYVLVFEPKNLVSFLRKI